MNRQERYDWLRLMWTPGLSFEMVKALLTAIGLPEIIFSSSYLTLSKVVPEPIARRLCVGADQKLGERIERALSWIDETPNADLITLIDPRYPSQMLLSPEPPLAFFVWGDTSYLSLPSVALVGSSHPNQEGLDLAREWAKSLSQSGVVLIEGMSEGIERSALKGLWKEPSAKAILVVDTPMAKVTEPVIEAMSQRHLVVSLNGPLDTIDDDDCWVLRNRLFLGLCSSFVLMQASARSRSLSLMREALDLNRNVMAVPGSIHSPLSKGSHRLIKQGARLVETTREVLEEMQIA